ncbi:MAG: AI-2E family transporter [Eubacterium sp.]|nr:AI-2E family transporter [Eubacterium sp.]
MKWDDPQIQKYKQAGITAFVVVAAALIVYFIFNNFSHVMNVVSAVNGALMPVYIGLVIAFLLSPLVNWLDRFVTIPLYMKVMKKEEKARKLARGTSVTIVLISFLVVLWSLVMMVIPEVVRSIKSLADSMPAYYHNIMQWIARTFERYPETEEYAQNLSAMMYHKMITWLQDTILPNSNKWLSIVTDGVVNVLSVLMNFLIGLIVSVYLLCGKENFLAQAKKILCAIFPRKWASEIMGVLSETNVLFAKFLSGKIIDSLIIGILAFIILTIAKIPYALLVSVIVGVTNIIPFFGPYIGAIPSAILVFIANPMKGIVFLIIIIVLQQFDGNILGPMILGDSTGLKSFWILFSILLFGSLFGLLGMICAVPVFAMIYRLVNRWCVYRLQQKGIPSETKYYITQVEPENIGKTKSKKRPVEKK